MDKSYFESILVCPKCKSKINTRIDTGKCPKCKNPYEKVGGIWHLLYIKDRPTRVSQKQYNDTHLSSLKGPDDGSYEILAAFARGNRTVDIACGQGHIERLAPETVGVEFSQTALKKAQRNGAKHLVLADAHSLPFRDNSFDLSISAGNLEHFANPQKAIQEMARISKMQILTVHRHPPVPGAEIIHKLITTIFNVKHQPIENPISENDVVKMLKNAGAHVVFRGLWTIPVNYGQFIKFLPEFKNIPACSFVISIKK